MGISEARIGDRNDLAYIVMVNLTNNAVQANIDIFGHDPAFKMFDPYIRLNARWCVKNFPEFMRRELTDLDGVISYFIWGFHMSDRAPVRCRLTGDGEIELEIKDCRVKGQSPNMCEWWCEREQSVMCEEFDHDLSLTLEERLSKGDARCLWRMKGKHRPLRPHGLNEEFIVLDPPDTPTDVFNFMSFAGPSQFMTYATTNLVENIEHERAVQFLYDRAKDTGRGLGAYYLNIRGRQEENAAQNLMRFIDDLLQMEGKDETVNEGGVERSIMKCPFSGCIPEVCKQIEAMRIGALEVVIPGKTISFSELRGQNECQWCLKRSTDRSTSANTIDDREAMLKVLKWRLVKGEITEVEFENLKGLIF